MGSATNLYFVKKDLLITDILHVSLEQRPDVYMAVWNTDKAKICASFFFRYSDLWTSSDQLHLTTFRINDAPMF